LFSQSRSPDGKTICQSALTPTTSFPLSSGPGREGILFYSNWGGPSSVSANLYTISPKGTGLKQLTHARGGRVQHLSATFSPDGDACDSFTTVMAEMVVSTQAVCVAIGAERAATSRPS
jgi:hypothetical protein